MANRQALRDLQARLAERLNQAQTERREPGWLAVECGGVGLLLSLAQAGEIFASNRLLPVPHTRDWMPGVVNLRGDLLTVVDLGAYLHLRPPMSAAAMAQSGCQLVLLNPALRVNCVLAVERLAGLRDRTQLTAEPVDGQVRPSFSAGAWRDAMGRRWEALDLASLALSEHFLDVVAAAD